MFYLSNILNWNQPFQYIYVYILLLYMGLKYGTRQSQFGATKAARKLFPFGFSRNQWFACQLQPADTPWFLLPFLRLFWSSVHSSFQHTSFAMGNTEDFFIQRVPMGIWVPWSSMGSRSNSQFVCGSLWQFYNVQVFRWKIMDLLNAEFCENSGTYGPLKECHKLSTHQKSSIFGGFFRFDPLRPSWPHVSPGSCGSLLRNPGAWLTPSSPGIPLIPCRDETTGCVGSGWKLYMII